VGPHDPHVCQRPRLQLRGAQRPRQRLRGGQCPLRRADDKHPRRTVAAVLGVLHQQHVQHDNHDKPLRRRVQVAMVNQWSGLVATGQQLREQLPLPAARVRRPRRL
jgi:hypothetical protein